MRQPGTVLAHVLLEVDAEAEVEADGVESSADACVLGTDTDGEGGLAAALADPGADGGSRPGRHAVAHPWPWADTQADLAGGRLDTGLADRTDPGRMKFQRKALAFGQPQVEGWSHTSCVLQVDRAQAVHVQSQRCAPVG